VDSLARLRSLLADAYADVAGEPLQISSIQIEIEQLDGAGFTPVDASNALRKGRLQQARSLRATALLGAAAPVNNSWAAAGDGRARV
jgi:hypothetical protein